MAVEIKPRVEDGVPWCDAGCPQASQWGRTRDSIKRYYCEIDSAAVANAFCVCPHAVRRMAVELEAWRTDELFPSGTGFVLRGHGYLTSFDAAVDALMEDE